MNKVLDRTRYKGKGRPRKSDYIPARSKANDRNYEAELINSTRYTPTKTDWFGYVLVVVVGTFLAYLVAHLIVA